MLRFAPLLLILAMVLAGCSEPGSAESAAAKEMPEAMAGEAPSDAKAGAPAESGEAAAKVAHPRKIIYTAQVQVVTEDIDSFETKLRALIKESGGFVGGSTRTGRRTEIRTGSWTIRLPSKSYSTFLGAVAKLGDLESSNEQSDDVSEEFYDAQARLKNRRLEETRLQGILLKATGKLTEVLTVEKELARVREEIERIEGRIRFLSDQVDLSTVTVSAREVQNYVPEGPPTLQTRVKRSWEYSVASLAEAGAKTLEVIVALVPWLVCPLLVTGIVVFFGMRSAKKSKPPVKPKDEE